MNPRALWTPMEQSGVRRRGARALAYCNAPRLGYDACHERNCPSRISRRGRRRDHDGAP